VARRLVLQSIAVVMVEVVVMSRAVGCCCCLRSKLRLCV